MPKSEAPPLRLILDKGRLVPASAWDAERLATYRNGSTVSARITQEKNRKLERKYWSILTRVVDTCAVKQRTSEELHRAIKWELDMVEGFSTIDGHLRVEVKSTAGMEEPGYSQFFEDAMCLLREKLDIDPETLGAEAADVGEDDDTEHSSPAESPTGDGIGALVATNSDRSAADNSPATADEAGSQDMGESESEPASVDPDWLKTFAKAIIGAIGEDEVVVVNQSKGLFVEGLSDDVRAKAKSITNYARACCRNEIELDDCRATIAGVVGCEEKDLAA
ncbi:hypothetical protein [Filomicrobium sp.]|uniref:hypothetical protein n=1 Tax=Filomicrobium sp. TaxID=2024831 RepID=UPI002585741A|nr:hypothetical protein [Filomicrobium sp.]MCV0371625.1 hypothetical protein [Filomicrobium sp.]